MRNYLLLMILAITALTGTVAQAPVIISHSQNMTVKSGQNVILECKFNTDVTCFWMRRGSPVKITERYRHLVPPTGAGTKDCSVQITNINQTDLGPWSCSTYDVDPIVIWLSELKIPSEPKIYFNGKPVKELKFPLPANIGPTTNLSCMSEIGNPAPRLYWELNRQRFPGNSRNITLAPDLYSTLLTWSQPGGWSVFNNHGELRCVGEHPGFATPRISALAFLQEYPTRNVQIQAEGLSGNEFELGRTERLVFTCIADGDPKPNYFWQFMPVGEDTWSMHPSGKTVPTLEVEGEQEGRYRCAARNRLNMQRPAYSTAEFVVKRKQIETTNFGVVIGIVIGCLLLLGIITLLVIFLYRRKKWFFAPKTDSSTVNVDAEAVDQDNEKSTEKTPLESVPDSQYENLKQNGKDEEMNGKTEPSPIKNDQNDNKKSTEVVYAQLDLSQRGIATVKPPPEYEKTEYAEITFNKDKGNKV